MNVVTVKLKLAQSPSRFGDEDRFRQTRLLAYCEGYVHDMASLKNPLGHRLRVFIELDIFNAKPSSHT